MLDIKTGEIILLLIVAIVAAIVLLAGTRFNMRWLTVRGRFRRKLFIVIYIIALIMMAFSFIALKEALMMGNLPLILVMLLAEGISVAITLASGMKRLQDIGWSGWYFVAYFILFTALASVISFADWIGYGVTAVLMVIKGQTGTNQYGADPRVKIDGRI